ncbi:uncharacterized protein IL334_004040 [Kwoniella shivajii]|uniref:HhH-GPD domain-containing protein n=1 Tax=Kwoniella shivajii TaxID=564305 RepID=A0ABZ1CZ84_9TREE|nr:hypothetical protein IL334_004040 [Kwoniella shivajii]
MSALTRQSSRLRSTPIKLKREASPSSSTSSLSPPPPAKTRKIKHERSDSDTLLPVKEENGTSPSKLKDRKLKLHEKNHIDGPFPSFARPTPTEAAEAHRILSSLHGAKVRPTQVVASKVRAGCGDSPSVLDALVRTILSQNTSDTNSTRAKLSMDKVYGSSDNWDKVVLGGKDKLQESIKCGGLSQVKSKVIIQILNQSKEKYGKYSLDHLHNESTEKAMEELLSFDGVGPKTASCVLLFCLQREDFAVDTHVHRITGLLGWRPKNANREQTYHHLNKRIPDEHKYGLHVLLVTHGKKCDECKAGGKSTGKCELRKAFKNEVMKGETEQKVKKEINDKVVKRENGHGVKEEKDENVKVEVEDVKIEVNKP